MKENKMKKYSYTLVANNKETNETDYSEIHDFVEAKDIADAYGKTLSVIAKLNKKNSDYVWILKNVENAYFVGFSHDCASNSDCADEKAE